MRPDDRSVSFTFHKEVIVEKDGENKTGRSTRQKLQDRFDKECPCSFLDESNKKDSPQSNRSVLSNITITDPRKALRNGADKLSKTLSNVRTTFGSFSQRFKTNTRRRQILQESPMHYPHTPRTRSREILGRTPTKLYSPFGIDSPQHNAGVKQTILEKVYENTENTTVLKIVEQNGYHYKTMNKGKFCDKNSKLKKPKLGNKIWNKENYPESQEKDSKPTCSWTFLNRNSRSLLK